MLKKAPSGIRGLDEITNGGLPSGRPTLVCGGPGSGKTLLAVGFLARGALRDNEPGVLISFDERISEIEVNNRSLGIDLADLRRRKLIAMDYVHLDRQSIIETGEFDLEGLFIRLDHAVAEVKAKRVVLDSIDTLFAGIPNESILRAELRRLFDWLKDRELTTVITAERGEGSFSRHGIEEYVSDCVILLDHRVHDELATRRLRIVKYRGSGHGGNEYPFLIEKTGLTLLPVTSIGLQHQVSDKRLSTGIAGLDQMLEGKGYYKGSSVLVGGGPGSGKTSLGAHFAAATCRRGERCLYFAFEESEAQLVRNMRTVGIDIETPIQAGNLVVQAVRPTLYSLEMHLAFMLQGLHRHNPDVVIVDPLSAMLSGGTSSQSNMMVLRLIDHLKALGITALYLSVQSGDENTELNLSSLMDTWLNVKNVRGDSNLERLIYVVKSRGMSHSPDIRRFAIGAMGVEFAEWKAAS